MTRYVLDHGGLQREYFVFLPSSYDGKKKHPVAIFMHGYGGTATGTEAEVAQGLNFYAEKHLKHDGRLPPGITYRTVLTQVPMALSVWMTGLSILVHRNAAAAANVVGPPATTISDFSNPW
jgi:hypothetical protein